MVAHERERWWGEAKERIAQRRNIPVATVSTNTIGPALVTNTLKTTPSARAVVCAVEPLAELGAPSTNATLGTLEPVAAVPAVRGDALKSTSSPSAVHGTP